MPDVASEQDDLTLDKCMLICEETSWDTTLKGTQHQVDGITGPWPLPGHFGDHTTDCLAGVPSSSSTQAPATNPATHCYTLYSRCQT
jgi:hypothetical protein